MDILKRILGYLRKYKWRTLIAATLLLMIILTRLVAPYLTKVLIDDVIGKGNHQLLFYILGLILLLSLFRGSMIYIRAYLFEDISQKIVYDFRTNLFKHLQELPFKFYDETMIGELMSRMTGDIEGIRGFLSGGITMILENAAFFIGATTMLFYLNVKLALVVMITTPFLAYLAQRFDKKIRPAFGAVREQNAVLNTRAQENIAGMRVVKAFAREGHEKTIFDKENKEQLSRNVKASFIWAKFIPLMDFVSSLSTVGLLLFGGSMVVNKEITLGTLVAFTGYIWMVTGPMRMLGFMINIIEQTIASSEKLLYLTDIGSILKEKATAIFPKEFKGHVAFQNVSFKYGDHEVLADVSFDLEPGKSMAIMGATGSGKTSFTSLMARFYDVNKGSVMIDGVDVRDMKLKELRREIGFVMQETFLFSDTIEANIAFGRPDIDREHVIAAAQAAQAHEFIMEMPDGYDTMIGERGMGLSGGQKQRVAIARALLKDPKILIMDDSTSSVDMETEYEIQKNLKQWMQNRTTFIIAHRISSVKDVDEIIVLDGGHIAERGNHHTLMAMGGLYHGMYMDQYKDFEEVNVEKKVI